MSTEMTTTAATRGHLDGMNIVRRGQGGLGSLTRSHLDFDECALGYASWKRGGVRDRAAWQLDQWRNGIYIRSGSVLYVLQKLHTVMVHAGCEV